jgi:hypothetical protein
MFLLLYYYYYTMFNNDKMNYNVFTNSKSLKIDIYRVYKKTEQIWIIRSQFRKTAILAFCFWCIYSFFMYLY